MTIGIVKFIVKASQEACVLYQLPRSHVAGRQEGVVNGIPEEGLMLYPVPSC